jgi:hypothetical protein
VVGGGRRRAEARVVGSGRRASPATESGWWAGGRRGERGGGIWAGVGIWGGAWNLGPWKGGMRPRRVS